MKTDYLWTDGLVERKFTGESGLEQAQDFQRAIGYGKVWLREFDADGYLEGVSDVTNKSQAK